MSIALLNLAKDISPNKNYRHLSAHPSPVALCPRAFLLGVLNPKVATAQTDGCPESCFCMEYMTCGSSDEKLYNGCNCCINPGCTLHLCSNTTISCPTN
ncbi:hypothetical protein CFP56_004419 [Quercus suber]|uniref:Uncharacterized protein n=1 Tax=Quercus suber TaxID=58331 RepID=A0AAW0IHB4_QUESU